MEIVRRRKIKHLVRDLYRGLLGREPDAEGARTYESLMFKLGPDRAVPKMLRAFLRSEEYRKREAAMAVSHVNAALASQGDQLIDGHPVNHVVSLGSFCLPGMICQDNGLRRYSLPFDWIFSTPRMVCHCLADDFAVFLDRRHYRPISDPKKNDPTRDAAADHDFYRERYGIPELFAHRDPTREADYLYYVRCVTRFRQILRTEDTKLFLVIGRAHHDLTNEFPRLVEALTCATTNFALLCIELLDPVERGLSTLVPVTRSGNHVLHRFTPSSFNPVGTFLPDKLDEWSLLRLIYRYKLDLKDSPWIGDESPEADALSAEEFRDDEELQRVLP
jgi:Putative papain-like cysteine peptidase (DUF1796)